MESWFFDGWKGVARVGLMAVFTYAALVFMLRISGKRTLSKMNAFDLVITVALGSALTTITLSKDTALAEGITALTAFIFLQFAVTWLSVRSERFQSMIKAQPRLLFHKGQFISEALRKERVTREEVEAAMRSEGKPELDNIHSVVLETDGTFSVLAKSPSPDSEATTRRVIHPPGASPRYSAEQNRRAQDERAHSE